MTENIKNFDFWVTLAPLWQWKTLNYFKLFDFFKTHIKKATIGCPAISRFQFWFFCMGIHSTLLYRPPIEYYSRFSTVSIFDDCSSIEGGICLWWDQVLLPRWTRPTTHEVLFKLWEGYLSLIKLFFCYPIGTTIIVPDLDLTW